MSHPLVIIGGGLTGLVAAEQLQQRGRQVLVLEREQEPGGCCRSISRDGYTFDYTGHLLHVAQETSKDYLERLGIWQELAVHTRQAGVWIGGHLTPYPIQINTHGLAPEVRRDCLLGFIRAWARQGGDHGDTGANPVDSSAQSFREWVLERFGDGLARHFFFPYNSKLLRAEPEELSLDWVGRYVPRPKLEEVVDGALGLHRGSVGYNATFRYPITGGIRLLPDQVAEQVNELRLGSEVVALSTGEHWLELIGGERLPYQRLVSTMSLPRLLDLLVEPLPSEIVEARRLLRWVAVLNVALGVQGTAPRPEHWLYFPDPQLPFYRVGFPSNHGRVAPAGHHTVSIEVSLAPASDRWGAMEQLATEAEEALSRIGLLDQARIRVRQVTVIDPAYVVFDHRRRQALAAIRRFLADHDVHLAGRWAEWKYSAMEDAILDGMRVADDIA